MTSDLAAGHGVGRSKRSDDTSPDQAVLARLTADLTELQAKVTALQNTVNAQEIQINDMKADRDRHVAFAAYINDEPNLAASAGATVAFAGVITNIGSAYNPATSVFTAPYDAIYMFFVRVDISHDCFGVDIRENGRRIAAANNDNYISTHVSAAVTLSLKTGDAITVTYFSTKGVVDAGIESVFTGFMLA
nr:hypothetical protein BaRGS_006709 [Batillaria attramentaria]